MVSGSKKGYLLCFLGVFSWSFSEITVKILKNNPAGGEVGPILLSFYRFFIGGLFLVALSFAKRDVSGMKDLLTEPSNLKLMIISSVVGLGTSNMIYFVGVNMVQANVGSALYTTYPIFISIYGIFILGEKTNIPFKLVGYALGFIGMLILVTDFNLALLLDPGSILGNILLVIAAAIWSLYSVVGKKLMRQNPGISDVETKFTGLSFLFACIPIVAMLVFLPGESANIFQHEPFTWLLIIFMGIVITALGLYVFFQGVKEIEVGHGISLALLKPVLVSINSFIILGELPTLALVVSIPIVFVAVLLINRKPSSSLG